MADLTSEPLKLTSEDAINYQYEDLRNESAKQGLNLLSATTLPKDVWGVILEYLSIYDVVFLRASSSWLFKLCKEFQVFPKYFVLDQAGMASYLVENGFVSCLDYAKKAFNFELAKELLSVAAKFGKVDALQHLLNNSFTLPEDMLTICAAGACDISMIKYLHESGVPWDRIESKRSSQKSLMENMAYHGHVECMKYAMEHGCNQQEISYTPSIECLDLAIQHGFSWKTPGAISASSICQEAARRGNLTILQYAHQNGASLLDSARIAARQGNLECLKYAVEKDEEMPNFNAAMVKTLECFMYLVEKYGIEKWKQTHLWAAQTFVGNLDILCFMIKNDFPLPDNANLRTSMMGSAMIPGRMNVLKFFLDEIQMPFDTSIPSPHLNCASKGNLEGLKLVFERNLGAIYLTKGRFELMFTNAIDKGSLDMLKFVWEKAPNKEEYDFEKLCNRAVARGTPQILDFFTQLGAEWNSQHLASALNSKNLPNLAFLIRQGCQWDDGMPLDTSDICLKYLRAHQY